MVTIPTYEEERTLIFTLINELAESQANSNLILAQLLEDLTLAKEQIISLKSELEKIFPTIQENTELEIHLKV